MTATVSSLTAEIAARLRTAGIEEVEAEARWLVSFVLGLDPTGFALLRGDAASEEARRRCLTLADRRVSGEPLQYILGTQPFFGASFSVGPGVLIPRPETEALAELCARRLKDRGGAVVYDLCAGSGCIGVSLALACPGIEVWLFELSEEAFGFLRVNIPDPVRDRVRALRHDIFTDCPAAVPPPDLIVSNPPYIPSAELPGLQREVSYEPAAALDGGEDGLRFYRRLCAYWLPLLRAGGFAAMECGEGQAAEILAMLPPGARGFAEKDQYGVDRFVCAAF